MAVDPHIVRVTRVLSDRLNLVSRLFPRQPSVHQFSAERAGKWFVELLPSGRLRSAHEGRRPASCLAADQREPVCDVASWLLHQQYSHGLTPLDRLVSKTSGVAAFDQRRLVSLRVLTRIIVFNVVSFAWQIGPTMLVRECSGVPDTTV